jgi:hypothetical protein
MRTLLITFALVAAHFIPVSAGAEPVSFHSGTAQGMSAALPAHPARYSFVEVYRLTLAGAITGQPLTETAPEAPVRVAVAQAQPAEPRFSISQPRQPEKWLLILVGLALAGWVAHRRLAQAL